MTPPPLPAVSEPHPRSVRSERILLVEDKEGLRQVLQKTLEAEGFAVEACGDGQEAMHRLGRERYLLVLTDLKLPRADGLQVLRAARQAEP